MTACWTSSSTHTTRPSSTVKATTPARSTARPFSTSTKSKQRAAQAKIKQLTAAKAFPRPIVTTLEPLKEFYPAEEYHQDYARRHPDQPYIQYHAIPRVCTVRDKHRELIKHADDPK